ncbi:phosphatidylinositol 4-kinase gamma 3-like [Chenopodium quinoa]|uniref:1-phosphatidylinositol 4-kinase n=1 Tax=Chenopodium quinoa TaxID=63459 RepID=A0A803L2K5_CHEQI|nr:phosphatidylinositol 4-kinase gamma 3-like [Chenopodium quinoa]
MSMASVALSPVQKDSLTIPSFLSGQHGYLTDESILIYLTVGGSVIPIRVLESDSVASVKLRIQNHKGFFVKNQKLVFDGRELARNDSSVRDYGVANETVLHLVLRLSNIQAITVRTVCGKEFEFHVERSRNVGYLKQQIAKKGDGLFDLKDQELIFDGEELEDQCQIQEYCKNNDAVIHLLVQKSAKVRAKPVEKDFEVLIVASDSNEKGAGGVVTDEFKQGTQPVHPLVALKKQFCRDIILEHLIVNPKIELPLVIRKLINSTFSGLDKGKLPVRSSEGCGGAYFMLDPAGQEYISVFKPIDEEPMAVNNPNGLPESKDGEGLKKGTQVGAGAVREVAAYILDHPRTGPRSHYHSEVGFAGVPPTALVKCLHKEFHHPNGYEGSSKNLKIGSLQMYMKNSGSCEDMGPSVFPVEEVHKISVLDIRLANADRHAGNILVSRNHEGQNVLIPIDHGYCLPSKFEDCTFDWLYWPQARQPYSPKTIKYIESLDAEEDIRLLKLHGWNIPPECARILRVSTMLLKKGVARGLTPFVIGSIMCRETLKKESVIELIVKEAEEALLPESSEIAFLETISSIMDRWLDELSP